MRTMAVPVALVVFGSIAAAQPGPTTQPQPQPYPQPYPPQPYPPPPHQYAPAAHYPAALTAEEHELLLEGEISDGAQFGGGVAALFIGFGSGQAIQGRWSDTGWIFTLGETASMVAMFAGVGRVRDDCVNDLGQDRDCDHTDGVPLIIAGALGFTVFRIWGTIDAFAGPNEHNRRVRDLKFRLGIPTQVSWNPYVYKTRDGGATAGLTLSF